MNTGVIVNQSWTAGDAGVARLVDTELPLPAIGPYDLLVEVQAVALNPIDLKMMRSKPNADGHRILGWDASGTVVEVGAQVDRFRRGDDVFYAGSILRDGAMQRFHAVDARLVGRKPSQTDFAGAAALPVASLVAWESLFERMRLQERTTDGAAPDILMWGAAGGVGTVAMQLAAKVAGCRVIASASRSESAAHCIQHGAAFTVDHTRPLREQFRALGIRTVPLILCLSDPADLIEEFSGVIAPFGVICCIAESAAPFSINALRNKSVTFAWEGMFTRSLFATSDMASQSLILNRVAELVDQGIVQTPLTAVLSGINAARLMEAYVLLEQRRGIGKMVLTR